MKITRTKIDVAIGVGIVIFLSITLGWYFWAIIGALALIAAGIYFGFLGASDSYAFVGKLFENTFMSIEANGRPVGMKICSDTKDFKGGKNGETRWMIRDKIGGPKTTWYEKKGIYIIGLWPWYRARWVTINKNSHSVIHPKGGEGVLVYELKPEPITTRAIPIFITHSFETASVHTRGYDETTDEKKRAKGSHASVLADEIAEMVALFQVQIKIIHAWKALYDTPDFMANVNGTLQSSCRDLFSEYTYLDIIQAKSEGASNQSSQEETGDLRGSKLKETFLKQFSARLKDWANIPLAAYGIEIIDIDFLDHHLSSKRLRDKIEGAQGEKFDDEARSIKADSLMRYHKKLAEGKRAYLSELMGATDDPQLIIAEIQRRALTDAVSKFPGQVLNLGGNGGVNTNIDLLPKQTPGNSDTPVSDKRSAQQRKRRHTTNKRQP